jgi:hypothetical protein
MNLHYQILLLGGWLYIVSGIIMTIWVIIYVRTEWNRKQFVSVSDIIGVISWMMLSWYPIANFPLMIVVTGNNLINMLIGLLVRADEKIIYKRKL